MSQAPLFHISFYKFVPLPDPDGVVDLLRELVAPLTGSVLVAHEGVSGALGPLILAVGDGRSAIGAFHFGPGLGADAGVIVACELLG